MACAKYDGFYPDFIDGPDAGLAPDCIKNVESHACKDLDMEVIWRIEVEGLSGFIVIDGKGNDVFQDIKPK